MTIKELVNKLTNVEILDPLSFKKNIVKLAEDAIIYDIGLFLKDEEGNTTMVKFDFGSVLSAFYVNNLDNSVGVSMTLNLTENSNIVLKKQEES